MVKYTVFEISGRQYLIEPGQTIEIDKIQSELGKLSVKNVLLRVDGDKIEVGTPFLKDGIDLEVVSHQRGKKIRVATYSPKANSRRVKGARHETTLVKLAGTEAAKKSDKKEVNKEEVESK